MSEQLNIDALIEVPFKFRHICWFCGEPANKKFSFPNDQHVVAECPHPTLIIPACQECTQLARQSKEDTIWLVRSKVKKLLISLYQKHLAIGLNWTKKELENSEFEGGNFEGFKKSAWFMYEVAKDRVNFSGWKLVLDGLNIEEEFIKEGFIFDGVIYPNVDEAIEYYTCHYALPSDYLALVVASIGSDLFSKAVSFSRLMVGTTPAERKQALRQMLVDQSSQ
ncbi:MAG: hypothetical protein ACSHW0_14950 [Thalassotalea sp.]